MKILKAGLFLGVLLTGALLAGGGCSKAAAERKFESDSNAYFCPACGLKFYTDRKVFADFCPACKELEIQDVMGYLCPEEHLTPALRGTPGVICKECGAKTGSVRLPRSGELEEWGAIKKEEDAVKGVQSP